MRPLMLTGLAIATAGLVELVFEYLVFAGAQSFIDAGSIKVTTRTDRFFPIPTLVAVFAIMAGVVMIYFGRAHRRVRRAN